MIMSGVDVMTLLWGAALSTALETLEAIDLDSWSGCVAIFAIIPALVTHVPSHAVTYYLLN